MNIINAKTIALRIAQIAELSATFNATYGHHHRLSEQSLPEAWELYRQIMREQTEVAQLLDEEALKNPYSRYGEWWKRADVMDCAIVNELAVEAFNLIERCAYLSVNEATRWANTDLVLQRSIAGMLHPATRLVSLPETTELRKAI
jgi:hypothetical protein